MTVIVDSRDSLLTTSSGYTNYRGILNLVIILLVLSNARAALENIIKYGILVDPISWFVFLAEGSKHWPALVIILIQGAHVIISLLTEKLLAYYHKQSLLLRAKGDNGRQTNVTHFLIANLCTVTNLLVCISLPPIIIYNYDTHPISTSASLMLVSIVFLKLVSYHMMNFWCRDLQRSDSIQSRTTKLFISMYVPPSIEFRHLKDESKQQVLGTKGEDGDQTNVQSSVKRRKITSTSTNTGATTTNSPAKETRDVALKVLSEYPNNINMADIWSYMSFPTLCYEIQYARTARIRKRFLIKRIVELLMLSQLDLALIQQWIVPTVSNSVLPFRQMQITHMLERLLKLAIPNHVIWLIWFYLFFHSLLNIAAELTRFADREFYRDWWNSESVYYFWSNWNIPVHKWCVRHLYFPLMSLGLNRCQASTCVFLVSAFFHEYLVSVPLQMFRMWAFTGMLIQLPWARFVSAYFNHQFANVAVWLSLIIGQPLCILMYYHDYYVINNKNNIKIM